MVHGINQNIPLPRQSTHACHAQKQSKYQPKSGRGGGQMEKNRGQRRGGGVPVMGQAKGIQWASHVRHGATGCLRPPSDHQRGQPQLQAEGVHSVEVVPLQSLVSHKAQILVQPQSPCDRRQNGFGQCPDQCLGDAMSAPSLSPQRTPTVSAGTRRGVRPVASLSLSDLLQISPITTGNRPQPLFQPSPTAVATAPETHHLGHCALKKRPAAAGE